MQRNASVWSVRNRRAIRYAGSSRGLGVHWPSKQRKIILCSNKQTSSAKEMKKQLLETQNAQVEFDFISFLFVLTKESKAPEVVRSLEKLSYRGKCVCQEQQALVGLVQAECYWNGSQHYYKRKKMVGKSKFDTTCKSHNVLKK